MTRRLSTLLLAAACAVACGTEDPPKSDPVDSGPPLDLVLHLANFIEEKQPMKQLNGGDSVDLAVALQGGHVIYIGAQVENMRTTQAEIDAKLVDPSSGVLRKQDVRTIVMKPVPEDASLMQPDIRSRSQVAHLVTCPNDGTRNIAGETWRLEVSMKEVQDGSVKSGPLRTGQASLDVVPLCNHADAAVKAYCECECEAGYALGKCVVN